jgi:hypothetical protein
MAIGNQLTYSTSSLNAELAEIAQEMQDAHRKAREFFERINAFGINGLEGIGFAVDDANNFMQTANYLNTDALIYYGQAAQTPAFNFDDACAKAR